MSKLLQSMPRRYDSLTLSVEQFRNMRSMCIREVIEECMSKGIKKEAQEKRRKLSLLGPLIRPRRVIMANPKEPKLKEQSEVKCCGRGKNSKGERHDEEKNYFD